MATLETHKSNRATAGAAYAAAAAAYIAAYVELQAYDMTVANVSGGDASQLGFGKPPEVAGHSTFLRDIPALTNRVAVADLAMARHRQLLAS